MGHRVEFNAIGATQLRLEGVDALELHFTPAGGAETHQPRPAADQARGFLTKSLGLDPVSYVAPDNVTVKPPVIHDGARGYILSRSLEAHGRPVSFVFSGAPAAKAGTSLFLDSKLLTQSLNYRLLRAGQAYPLYYDTLFADLRATFSKAVRHARGSQGSVKPLGIWSTDVTSSKSGLAVLGIADLEQHGYVFPKLFRRLAEWLATGAPDAAGFAGFNKLATEQVLILDRASPEFTNMTHLDNVIEVNGVKVKMRFALRRRNWSSSARSNAASVQAQATTSHLSAVPVRSIHPVADEDRSRCVPERHLYARERAEWNRLGMTAPLCDRRLVAGSDATTSIPFILVRTRGHPGGRENVRHG